VIGKFLEDWNYALIYDFGGASDGFGGTAGVNGAAVGFLPGGAVSGIENAYLSYTGIKPFGGKLAVEGGIMDLPYTLDEASSSNDIPFMERAASGITAPTSRPATSVPPSHALVHRHVLGRRLCNGARDGRHSLRLERQPQRHQPNNTARSPVSRASRQRQGLLAAYRRRCRMADPAAA